MTAIAKTNSDLDSRITAYADAIVRNAHVMNGVKHIEIPCSLLRLDEAYQRKESGYAGRIAEQWDNHKAKDIIVSYRDSEFKVIDGANRVRAAMLRGQDTLNCIIYEGLTEAEEAKLFATQDEYKKPVSSYEKLRAFVVAEDPASVAMTGICREFKIKIGTGKGTGKLSGIKAMSKVFGAYGPDGLRWVFRVIERAGWHDAPGAYSAAVLRALGSIYGRLGSGREGYELRLIRVLKSSSPRKLLAMALLTFPDRGESSALTACLEGMMQK